MSKVVTRTQEVRDILMQANPMLEQVKTQALAHASEHFRQQFQKRGMDMDDEGIDVCARVVVAAVWGAMLMPVGCKDSTCLRAEAIHSFAGSLRILAFGDDDVKKLHADMQHAVEHMEDEHPELAAADKLTEALVQLLDPGTMGTPRNRKAN